MSLPSLNVIYAGYSAVGGSDGSATPRDSLGSSTSCPYIGGVRASPGFRSVGTQTGTPPEAQPKERVEKVVGGKFRVLQKIGEGSFGVIRLGLNILNEERVAVKLEEIGRSDRDRMLQWEYNVYKQLHEGRTPVVGIPRALYYGVTNFGYNALVLDLMGPNLEDLFVVCKKRFTDKTVLTLADQMISRLEVLHSKGYIHRDMKPENFVMGTGCNATKVFLIDFGLCKKYLTPGGKHVREVAADRETVNPPGTLRYVTLNAHQGKQQSRRDDLESLGLMMMYLLRGSLPWDDALEIQSKSSQVKDLVKQCKESVTIEELCKGFPAPFAQYLNYCRKLKYDEKPNYFYLRKIFRYSAIKNGYMFADEYDWSEMQKGKTDGEWRQFVAQKVATAAPTASNTENDGE